MDNTQNTVKVSRREAEMEFALTSMSEQLNAKSIELAKESASRRLADMHVSQLKAQIEELKWTAEFYGSELEKYGGLPEVPPRDEKRVESIPIPEEMLNPSKNKRSKK